MKSLQNPSFTTNLQSVLQILSSSPPKLPNPKKSPPFFKTPTPQLPNTPNSQKIRSFLNPTTPHLPNPSKPHVSIKKVSSFFNLSSKPAPSPQCAIKDANFICFLASISFLSIPLPSFASIIDDASGKINIESIVNSIKDFLDRYPFFVAGLTVIWLVVIPLVEEYLKKCKPISAIDAFRKLRDLPDSQLLDIRRKQSHMYMDSPNLSVLNKNVVWVEFVEEDEDGFLKEVSKRFKDGGNTVLCVLDNFDGNSLKAAELLFEKGFKEAYAIKGGLRGPEGWQAIQENLLPPAVHVYPRKKKKKSKRSTEAELNGQTKDGNLNDNGLPPTSIPDQNTNDAIENGYISATRTASEAKPVQERPSSPYPNYPGLKPPSSPTPSKPQDC